MKTCPQCNVVYENDYLFCLTDGNTLLDESGEQETHLRNRIVFSEMAPGLSEDVTIACSKCGLANRANSKFCKKCGGHLGGANFAGASSPPPFNFSIPISQDQVGTGPGRIDETVAFKPPVFTPPVQSAQIATGRTGISQNLILLIGFLAAAVIIGGAIVYSMSGDDKRSVAPANGNKTANTANASKPVNTSPTNSDTSDSRVGKTGTFSTDSHLRQTPGSREPILGAQYAGARVRILSVASVPNDDGGTSTWFEVQITSYGHSLDPKNYGLEKDPGTPDRGWVNSYPVVYVDNGTRKAKVNLINFD